MKETIIELDDARILQVSFGENQYSLLYSGQAMFDVDELVGEEEITAALTIGTKEGFTKLCRAAAILSEQAELARRYMGHEAGQTLDENALQLFCSPQEKVRLYGTVIKAYCLGWGQEIKEKKKKSASRGLPFLKRKTRS